MTLIAIGGPADSGIGTGGSHVQVQNVHFVSLGVGVKPAGDRWLVSGCRITSVAYAVEDTHGTLFTQVVGNNFSGTTGRIKLDLSIGAVIANNVLSGTIEGNPDRDIHIEGNVFLASSPVDHDATIWMGAANGGERISVVNNQFWDQNENVITFDGVSVGTIAGNLIQGALNGITVDSCADVVVSGNNIYESGESGIIITDSVDCQVEGNKLAWIGMDDTDLHDGIRLEGATEGCFVHGNLIVPSDPGETRNGIMVDGASCVLNRIVGNSLGDPADYGTNAITNTGTSTSLTWPADATYGDNFTT